MMLPLYACVLLAQGTQQAPATPAAPPPPSGAALVSKMFQLYAGAKSVEGKIRMTQKMSGHEVTVDTDLALEFPSKIYLRQLLNAGQARDWLVTSDGTTFTYNVPNAKRWSGGLTNRLWENVKVGNIDQTYRDIYQASSLSLGDKGIPEDIAIAGRPQLENVRYQLATIVYKGKTKLGDVSVNVIAGDWRAYGKAPVSAKYEMYITDDGQLKRYTQDETISVGPSNLPQSLPPQEVLTVWDVDLKVGVAPSEDTFKVVR
jgi:outer membrane lipoprotein-sorting protein